MAKEQSNPSWVGPIAGAIILIGGYVAYQQWHEYHQHQQECADLRRAFSSNVDSMIESGPVQNAIKQKSQLPMLGVVGQLAANQAVMDTLNAKCPGWQQNRDD